MTSPLLEFNNLLSTIETTALKIVSKGVEKVKSISDDSKREDFINNHIKESIHIVENIRSFEERIINNDINVGCFLDSVFAGDTYDVKGIGAFNMLLSSLEETLKNVENYEKNKENNNLHK